MFAERFDALMNIAEVSNSLLGRDINMNPSHIGRLRSGARPLAKKHDYLSAICRYLAKHIEKDYQLNALQKLTGLDDAVLTSQEGMADFLEGWLIEPDLDDNAANARLTSGVRRSTSSNSEIAFEGDNNLRYASYLYGNAGKRKAVEQFFNAILREKDCQTILLFSDENVAWLFEDETFVAKWKELFGKVIAKGNKVKIIHDVSRNMSEMLDGVINWIPIYLTGAVEPYAYPRLRDGVFQKTLFIAPKTAAVVASSVMQNTDGMLNFYISDSAAVEALSREYDKFFSVCKPLMRIYNKNENDDLFKAVRNASAVSGDSFLYCPVIPAFAFTKEQIVQVKQYFIGKNAKEQDPEYLISIWEKSADKFTNYVATHKLTITLPCRESAMKNPAMRRVFPVPSELNYILSEQQYDDCIERLKAYSEKYHNFSIRFSDKMDIDAVVVVKESESVFIFKIDSPTLALGIDEKSMVSAFWDCALKGILF